MIGNPERLAEASELVWLSETSIQKKPPALRSASIRFCCSAPIPSITSPMAAPRLRPEQDGPCAFAGFGKIPT